MKNVVLPISQEFQAKPLTAESIGVIGHMPISQEPVNLNHIQISSALRERIKKIRFEADENTSTDKSNKPQ